MIRKIVKNCLIGASLVVMLAFTLFLSINAKNNIKAESLVTYSDKIVEPYQMTYNTPYYIDIDSYINLLENYSRTSYGIQYSTGESTTRKTFININKYTINDDSGVKACVWDSIDKVCDSTDNYNFNGDLLTGSVYYTFYTSGLYPNLYVNNERADLNNNNQSILIINDFIYLSSRKTLILENNSPILLGSIFDSLVYFNFIEGETISTLPQYFRYNYNTAVNPPLTEAFVYLNAELSLPIVEKNPTLEGLVTPLISWFPLIGVGLVNCVGAIMFVDGALSNIAVVLVSASSILLLLCVVNLCLNFILKGVFKDE